MTNKQLLCAKLMEKGISRKEAADVLGITLTAFENKLANRTEFKASEIATLSDVLGISKQKDKYFFA